MHDLRPEILSNVLDFSDVSDKANLIATNVDSTDNNTLNYLGFVSKLIIPLRFFYLTLGSGLAIVFKYANKRNSVLRNGNTVINRSVQASEHNTFYRPELVVGTIKQLSQIFTAVFRTLEFLARKE